MFPSSRVVQPLGNGADTVAGAKECAGEAGAAGCDRSRGGDAAEAAPEHRLVVSEPQCCFRVGEGQTRQGGFLAQDLARAGSGTRRTAARSSSGTALFLSASITSGTKSRLPWRNRASATFKLRPPRPPPDRGV